MPSLVYAMNPLDPLERRVQRIPKNRKIAAMCPKTDYPVVCIFNGKPLLRAGWSRRVKHGDVVAFVAMPRGGGGGFLRLAAAVAVAYFAPVLAGEALGTTFGAYAATAMGSTQMFMAVATTLIGLAVNTMFNALLPSPKLPTAQSTAADVAAASPTYNLAAQGNVSRLEQPIPVQYGRHIAYPDFAATPYQEYADNEQWLYQLFVVGQGYFDIEAVRIEDTPIAQFDGATVEIVPPGGSLGLFPASVVQSIEVSGGELGSLGPYIASPAGTAANYIGVDLVCNGLYYANDQGGFDTLSLSVRFDAQLVDDAGAAIGGWVTLGTETITGATNTAIRRSYRYAVTPGRYQVRAVRLDSKDTRSRAAHSVLWAGLRAYLPDQRAYGDVTLLAVRLKATSQLSSQASRKINVIATRKLPTWNPSSGWSAPVATRSIAWALADICRARYGASLADDAYDLAGLYALDQVWAARGDTFDARFDGKSTVGEALTLVARAGRAKWFQQAGQVRFWRDRPQSIPVAMFTTRNITPGSFGMIYVPAFSDGADAVRLSYFDERFWSQRDVTCSLPGSTGSAKPAESAAFGMVNRQQVVADGMYMAAVNRYRRRIVTFATEAEGLIPRFGDLIGISHDVPSWGQAGDCVGWSPATKRLQVSEPLSWVDGQSHYVRLVRSDGGVTANIQVSKDPLDERAVYLASDPGIDVEVIGDRRERTRYVFGPASNIYVEAIINRVTPKGGLSVEIESVLEDPRVHTADANQVADAAVVALPKVPSAPVVTGLKVIESGTPSMPIQIISWNRAEGATAYWIEYTTDGSNWSRAGDTTGTGYTLSGVPVGQVLDIRVAGFGLLRGPWVSWHGTSGASVGAPGGLVDLALESAFVGPEAVIKWSPAARADKYRVEVWAGGGLRRQVYVVGTRYAYTVEDAKQDGGPWRSLTFWVTPMGVGAGPASSVNAFNPNVGQLNSVNVTSMATGALWSCTPPSDPDIAGFVVYASKTSGFTPGPSNLVYEGKSAIRQLPLEPNRVWYLRCGAYDAWGKDGLQLTGEITVNTGAVQADHLSVANLAAIVANLGEIIAGRMHSADNAVDLDLDAKQFLVRDDLGNERVKLGRLAAGKYGLRVSNAAGSKQTVITPNIGTVIASGEVMMPNVLNADGSYNVAIQLDRAYQFADLSVIVSVADDAAPMINFWNQWVVTGWGANWNPIYWKNVFGATVQDANYIKERIGATAGGQAMYQWHGIGDLGNDGHAVLAVRNYTRWDKGYATSGDKIYVTAVKSLSIADKNNGTIRSCIEIGWPLKASYIVIARNYQG